MCYRPAIIMLEEGSQKILDIISDKLNTFFSKKPVFSTLLLSLFVSLVVFFVGTNYGKENSEIKIRQEDAVDDKAANNPAAIRVDLAGGFRSPGVYSLPFGSRVNDALGLAGGLSSDSCSVFVSKSMNLSEVLSDGAKIYIPFIWEVSLCALESPKDPDALVLSSTGNNSNMSVSNDETGLVDVNDASKAELDVLPGIGKTYAERIVDGRPYTSFADFKARSRLPESLIGSLEGLIKF